MAAGHLHAAARKGRLPRFRPPSHPPGPTRPLPPFALLCGTSASEILGCESHSPVGTRHRQPGRDAREDKRGKVGAAQWAVAKGWEVISPWSMYNGYHTPFSWLLQVPNITPRIPISLPIGQESTTPIPTNTYLALSRVSLPEQKGIVP